MVIYNVHSLHMKIDQPICFTDDLMSFRWQLEIFIPSLYCLSINWYCYQQPTSIFFFQLINKYFFICLLYYWTLPWFNYHMHVFQYWDWKLTTSFLWTTIKFIVIIILTVQYKGWSAFCDICWCHLKFIRCIL